jgi:uracil-DNA glycosylase
MSDTIQLHNSWKDSLAAEFAQPYMQQLKNFLLQRKAAGAVIYPRGPNIFNALNTTPFAQVRVVILGQDPYHGPGQAHGLSFSVPEGVPHPPSLQNIFKEREADLGLKVPTSGCLEGWAQQGVLLLNSVLTVEEGQAAAHAGKGWEQFTDKIIHLLNDEREHIVFILWGSYAQKKGQFINRQKHLVIESPHPSPLSAHRGFFGSKPFSKTNNYLAQHGLLAIKW